MNWHREEIHAICKPFTCGPQQTDKHAQSHETSDKHVKTLADKHQSSTCAYTHTRARAPQRLRGDIAVLVALRAIVPEALL